MDKSQSHIDIGVEFQSLSECDRTGGLRERGQSSVPAGSLKVLISSRF